MWTDKQTENITFYMGGNEEWFHPYHKYHVLSRAQFELLDSER